MVRKNYILFVLLFTVSILSGSCKQEASEIPSLSVTPTSLSIVAEGGYVSFTVTAGSDWLVHSDQSWAKPTTASGKATTSPVKVSVFVEDNETTAERKAVVTVKTLSNESVNVNLIQAAGGGSHKDKGIASADDLVGFAKALSEGGAISPYLVNGVAKLLCNIDASAIKEWIPIGTAEYPMTCGFDGDGYKITGLSCSVDLAKYPLAGFIGYAKGGMVKKLTLEGEMTFKGNPSAQSSVGGVAGSASGVTFENVKCGVKLSFANSLQVTTAVGGLVGRTDSNCILGSAESAGKACIFNGEILVPSACFEGGLVGYNEGMISNCTNSGSILGKDAADSQHGPGWGCGYNKTYEKFKANSGYGHVGDYDSFKSKPASAPDANYMNCMVCKNFDVLENTVDRTLDSFYDWEQVDTKNLSSCVKYTHYNCTGIPRHVHVLDIDLSDPSVEVTTSYSEDIVPNPNGNKNSNNGKNIRETLSEVCGRVRSEGNNIVAGVNSGFFDSNDGISRGYHIQDAEPVYGSYYIYNKLPNHKWALTVFTDGTASAGTKSFKGMLKAGGREYEWYSVNDTTLRHTDNKYPVNIYTSRYKKYPHPEKTSLVNKLADNALYVVAEYTGENMKVNCGYADAKVKAIYDGRGSKLQNPPYLTSSKEVAIALCDVPASEVSAAVHVNDIIQLKFDMTIKDQTYGDVTKPILTQNSSMYEFLSDGKDASSSSGIVSHDPVTFVVLSKDAKRMWLVEVDGRQDWYSVGLNGYEIYRIGLKLGGWNSTRFDGGGSACMWVYDSNKGSGALVNRVSDSKGERSCLNYLLVKLK